MSKLDGSVGAKLFLLLLAVSLTLTGVVLSAADVPGGLVPHTDGGSWHQLTGVWYVPPRGEHAMAWNSDKAEAFLFGGISERTTSPTFDQLLDDNWKFDGNEWTRFFPDGHPERRGSVMVYDPDRKLFVLFGGLTENEPAGDTWEYDPAKQRWQRRYLSPTPDPRYDHAMIYDVGQGIVIMFGGRDLSRFLNDTWEFNGQAWTRKTLSSSPPARAGAAMAYDSERDVVVLFGGRNSDGMLGDTWQYNGTAWEQVQVATSPPARANAGMAYDSTRHRLVLFGGRREQGLLGDTWEFDAATWTHISSNGPPAREGMGMVYAGASLPVLLFGGFGQGAPFNDTWVYQVEEATHTPTPTVTSKVTPSYTPSPSPAASPSPTPTASTTPTPTNTLTATPTPTVSVTSTPSATATPSPTAIGTLTPTATRTGTVTPQPTPSPSPTASTTPTETASATYTASPTFTWTPTATASATLTVTPSATAKKSPGYLPLIVRGWPPTPTPTLTATPSFCDGGFEAGRFEHCWEQGGELPRSVVEQLNVGEPNPTTEPALAGRYSALLGDPSLGPGLPTQPGIPVGSAWIEQAVTVPNTAAPRLSFWYRIITYDVAQDALRQFWDIFSVEINGELVLWDGNRVPGTSQRRHDLGSRQGQIDLSHWRGQTVTVRFANWNGYIRQPGAELYNTWTYLDEVQVQP